MVKDLVKNLCVSLETDIGGVSGATSRKVVVATPVITLTGNSVTITCATTGATIYYTLDGSTPTSSSTQYSAAFTLDSSCTIKAIAIKGGKSSGIAEEEYVKPIIYLTQWKIVGNSEVHGVGNLTSWKVEGNSVVDNNTILSCGDLGQDGKYHVKISNGVNVFDIVLDAPLRKVGDVADTIEFPSNTEGKALVTRPFGSKTLSADNFSVNSAKRLLIFNLQDGKPENTSTVANILVAELTTYSYAYLNYNYNKEGLYGASISTSGYLCIADSSFIVGEQKTQVFNDFIEGKEIIYELATPTIELVDAPQIAVSPTDTYTSANTTPYSAFEYTKHSEIWSCGEYSEIDNKYHIVVLPQGKSPVDIALTEPLRKVNDVADTIEFPSEQEDKALVTRTLKSILIGNTNPIYASTVVSGKYRWKIASDAKTVSSGTTQGNILSSKYPSITTSYQYKGNEGVCIHDANNLVIVYDELYTAQTDADAFKAANADVEVIYELATPTTELVDAPQIAEADSYSMVISQGGKAVSWSSFETE